MNRRKFIGTVAASVLAAHFYRGDFAFAEDAPEISFTFDDFNLFETLPVLAAQRNRAMLDALKSHSNLKAAMFVTGKFIDSEDKREYLRAWNEAGHTVGNHTYSHFGYHNTSFEKFSCDVLRGEAVIKDFRNFKKLFRFPFLKEGDTTEKRDQMRRFLKENGYRNGYVTIDASDWYVDARLRARLKREPNADLAPYRRFYLEHLWERAKYYDELTRKVVGRTIKHNVLLHHNVVNGLFLKGVLEMFAAKGWKLIDADAAFADPIYSREPNSTPAGESLIWALAKETGKYEKELRYPGESDVYEKPKMDALGL